MKNQKQEINNLFTEIIEKNGLKDEILSVYLYGSLAQDDFEKGHSDIDLWVIIKDYQTLSERIEITKRIINIIDVKLVKYLDNLHSKSLIKQYHYHGNWYFTESEFLEYIYLYPTRVLYPIYNNVWYSIYGLDYKKQLHLVTFPNILHNLLLDFELFSREVERFLFGNQTRDLIKYTTRAIKKALWIITGEYIKNRKQTVNKAIDVFPEENTFQEFKKWVRRSEEDNYCLDASEQLQLSIVISQIMNFMKNEICKFLIENEVSNVSESEVAESDLWGNFHWSFTELLTDFLKIPQNDIKGLTTYLEDSYFQMIQFYMYIIRFRIQLDKWYGKKELPLKSSAINKGIDNYHVNKDVILSYEGAEYLLINHINKIINHKFEFMSEKELRQYIEQFYLPNFYVLYNSIKEQFHDN